MMMKVIDAPFHLTTNVPQEFPKSSAEINMVPRPEVGLNVMDAGVYAAAKFIGNAMQRINRSMVAVARGYFTLIPLHVVF